MAHDHDTLIEEEVALQDDAWSGGKPPMKASYGKLMMWYFLLSDAFTFAGFLIAYGTLRFSSATWPIPDSVFSTAPFGIHEWFTFWGGHAPLLFVTFMSFLLIISSVTMVRAVQEGHRENKRGVAYWMFLTILGGIGFLSCQAWEWSNLIGVENMTVTKNPFGTHTQSGIYLNPDGTESSDVFDAGDGYLMHMSGHGHAGHGEEAHDAHGSYDGSYDVDVDLADGQMDEFVDFPGYRIDKDGYILRKFKATDGENAGQIVSEQMGPKAFGALFFFITGFHGFHVFSGVLFLVIIMVNVMSGLYEKRKNGYEMVEKIGLYWHFVDLVWVFVFLVFYLL